MEVKITEKVNTITTYELIKRLKTLTQPTLTQLTSLYAQVDIDLPSFVLHYTALVPRERRLVDTLELINYLQGHDVNSNFDN